LIRQVLSGDFFRADALEDAPALLQGSGCVHYVVDLIAAREWAPVEEEDAIGLSLQEVASSFQHDLKAEVILPGRVFDFPRRKERVADLVFAQHTAGGAGGQLAGERGFAGAGKARHQDNHAE
jgi:hypothetical protein